MNEFFFIVYPGGDKSKISVVSLNEATRYEKNEYAVASRNEFYNESEAVTYAKKLAKDNNKDFVDDSPEADYLD